MPSSPTAASRLASPSPGAVHSLKGENRFGVLLSSENGDQVVRLKDEPDTVPPDSGQVALTKAGEIPTLQKHSSRGGAVQSTDEIQNRGLARSGGPTEGGELTGLDDEVQSSQGMDLHVTLVIDASDGLKLDDVLGWGFSHVKAPVTPSVQTSRMESTGATLPARQAG